MLLWDKCYVSVNGSFSELNNEQGSGFVGEIKTSRFLQ